MSAAAKNASINSGRSVDITRDLDAPVDVVWRALTDPKELVRWFPTDASIEPRLGGAFTIAWEGKWQWEMTITDWQPMSRLRMVDRNARPFDASGEPIRDAAPTALALEITLEARGDKTTLRLVHSGFGHGGSWDDEVDGVTLGWQVELRGLRHYLAHHRGHDRAVAWAHTTTAASLDAVWSHLVTKHALVSSDLAASLREGDRCALTLATGDRVDGPLVFFKPGRQLVLASDALGSGLFRLSLDRAAGEVMVQIWISSWTRPATEIDALGSRVREALDRAVREM